MTLLLDTCIVSDAARNADAALERWLRSQSPLDLHLSVLSLGEIRKGIELLATAKKREKLRAWLEHDLQAQFAGRLLGVTSDVAREWGRLTATAQKSGRPLPVIDGLLLATAQAHGLTFVTRNTKDVDRRGVAVLNPYSTP
ncbi:MAG: type II toxin-antitoxin system VapC family toxin [Pseudonocardiales bacterium]|nr:type II toxin-antitoxin system VapC family toxin [Pseudonocardiales bacterium]